MKKNKSKSSKSEDQNAKQVEIDEGLFKNGLVEQGENDTNMLIISDTNKRKKSEKNAESNSRQQNAHKLSNKERKRLEKVLERKEKNARRSELLEKLATVQIKPDELKLYKSVKYIGKKEKRKRAQSENDEDNLNEANPLERIENDKPKGVIVNSISGSNKKRKNANESDYALSENSSIDTDDMSTDSEVDDAAINQALEQYKKQQSQNKEKTLQKSIEEYKSAKIESDDEDNKENSCKNASLRVTKYVHVERRDDIKESRSKLPIITEEQAIMEKINDNDLVIICGETGSGKTTQVPQFLYEAGYAEDGKMIGITEPRRVAAISMSKRVNDEMNFDEKDSFVSYQIRYEGNYSPNTRIKFMTDGVLLKEIQYDFMLSKYSAIIIDEAHERSVYTDILIGLLSRIVPLRNKRHSPLKLIVMSATLRVEDFTENRRLFKDIPPSIKVDARQFPVSIHFNKHTYEDYMSEAYRKACKIHRRLPEGGILIFVTGQQEVNVLCHKLKKTFPMYDPTSQRNEQNLNAQSAEIKNDEHDSCSNSDQESLENREINNKNKQRKTSRRDNKKLEVDKNKIDLKSAPKVNLNNYSTMALDEELDMLDSKDDEDYNKDQINMNEIDGDLSSHDEEEENENRDNPFKTSKTSQQEKSLYVLPLYSLLSSEKQARVFESIPDGCRLCVVATNVAETSLTIPNIKYVVDTGKIKTKFYDKITGVSTFKICWTSKASADQRAGRAGRTSPGHCYRLYSSAVYNDEFPKFSEPEIRRKPVEDLILQMKDLGIDRISNFPFPTPPDPTAVKAAENLLVQLGALEFDNTRSKSNKDEQITKITNLGKVMASFPINPRYSKMLTLASQQENKSSILSFIICLISGLSVPELFVDGDTTIAVNLPANKNTNKHKNETQQQQQQQQETQQIKVKYSQIRQAWLNGVPGSHSQLLGDLMLLLVALGAVEYELYKSESDSNQTVMKFCEQYGVRYKAIVEARKLRKQLINTVNLIFPNINLAIDPQMAPPTQEQAKLLRQIVLSGLVDKIAKRYDHTIAGKDGKEMKNAYQSNILEEPTFIHPSSVLFKELPEYVCYVEIAETSKMYMKGVCAIESTWLPVYLSNQCKFDKPLLSETAEVNSEQQKPRFDAQKGVVVCHRESMFGRVMWPIRAVEVDFPPSLDLFKWFAKFLLDGDVIENMKKYQPVLLASPTTMLKSWAKLQPRTEKLLNALITHECNDKKKLLDIWSKKSDYLLNEYLMWIPESLHFELSVKWPPIGK